MRLSAPIRDLAAYIPQLEARNEKVSKVNVAWQVDHSLQVLIAASKGILDSDPTAYQAKFNLKFELLSLLNWLPRGKGRAPKAVIPQGTISDQSLRQKVAEAEQLLKSVESLGDEHYFNHPLFGHLKKQRALRFLGLHTEHHLKIVREILASG